MHSIFLFILLAWVLAYRGSRTEVDIILLVLLVGIIVYNGIQLHARKFWVTSDCMEPAIKNGSYIYVYSVALGRILKAGHIIVFKHEEKVYYSRVVALDYDMIQIKKEEIIAAQTKKRQDRGGFSGRKFVDIAEHPVGSFGETYCLNDPEKYPEIVWK